MIVSNFIKSIYSYILSRFGKNKVIHLPWSISVEPADYCMLRCPQCPVGIRKRQKDKHLMSLPLFKKLLDEVQPFCGVMQFHFQGEPLLNQDLPIYIAMAHKARIYTLLSTNAQMLTKPLAEELIDAGLNEIIISMDGVTQETYEQYRVGGDIDKVKQALRYLADYKASTKSGIKITLQCLCLKTNEHEWNWLMKHYKDLGATDFVLKPAQFYDFEHGNPMMPTNEHFSRYILGQDGLYHLKKKLHNHCPRLWWYCVVAANGDVLPCCFDKDHEYVFGNIQKQSFREIWFGEKAQQFRKQVLTNRASIPMCLNCTE